MNEAAEGEQISGRHPPTSVERARSSGFPYDTSRPAFIVFLHQIRLIVLFQTFRR